LCFGSNGESNDAKFRQLQRMAQQAPVIPFRNAELYHSLVSDPDRNYTFFLLFTATSAQYKCATCVVMAEELKKFAQSYEVFYGQNYHSPEFLANPFFLGQIEPSDAMEVFNDYQISTIPHFIYSPPGGKKVTKFHDDQYLRHDPTKLSTYDIIDFVNRKISVEVPLYVPLLDRILPVAMFLAAVVLLVRLVRKFKDHLHHPMLWYSVAFVTYMIVMAGVVYNRLRNPRFWDVQQNGHIALISPSPRSQYVSEGIIVAIVLGGLGLMFVALGDWVPRVKGPWRKRVSFWFATVLLFMFLTTLNNIFHAKYHHSAFRINWALF